MALKLESAILQLIAVTDCVGNFPARGTTAGILFRSESREDGQTGEFNRQPELQLHNPRSTAGHQ